jgi:putative ABC transport system ATP-binding protein
MMDASLVHCQSTLFINESSFYNIMKKEVLLQMQDVWKIYHMGEVEVHALRGITLQINKGDFVAIIGSSGSGKSTMMNLIGCLDIPSKGSIILKDRDITSLSESDLATLRGRTIGFIFQQYNLIPSISAYDNVMLPLEFLEMDEGAASETAIGILQKVGLGERLRNLPTQLSGGQQQRVSIARSLVTDPEIILADEPTGNLDSETGKGIMQIFQDLWKSGKTIIMVTHDLKLAKYANTIIELKDGTVVREVEK